MAVTDGFGIGFGTATPAEIFLFIDAVECFVT
jgi:hypothetical protein